MVGIYLLGLTHCREVHTKHGQNKQPKCNELGKDIDYILYNHTNKSYYLDGVLRIASVYCDHPIIKGFNLQELKTCIFNIEAGFHSNQFTVYQYISVKVCFQFSNLE